MGLILIVILVVLVFGGPIGMTRGYYGWGGVGSIWGIVVIILLAYALLGGFHHTGP